MRWVIGILGLSAHSAMAAGAQAGAGLILHGAGLGVTTLQKTNQTAEPEQILIIGPSR